MYSNSITWWLFFYIWPFSLRPRPTVSVAPWGVLPHFSSRPRARWYHVGSLKFAWCEYVHRGNQQILWSRASLIVLLVRRLTVMGKMLRMQMKLKSVSCVQLPHCEEHKTLRKCSSSVWKLLSAKIVCITDEQGKFHLTFSLFPFFLTL